MREQSRLHVQITLKELVSDALMFGFFFSILAICKKNQSLRRKPLRDRNKYSQKQSKTEDYKSPAVSEMTVENFKIRYFC